MSSRKLFNEWYGYDKKLIRSPDSEKNPKITKFFLVSTINHYNAQHIAFMPSEIAQAINDQFPNRRESVRVAKYWRPDCDSRTSAEFLEWMTTLTSESLEREVYGNLPWYATEPSENLNWYLRNEIYDFYKYDNPRSDKLFRLIELSEFIERGNDTQTFREFLLEDQICAEKCRTLDTSNLENYEHLLQSGSPKFFNFGRGVSQKSRDLFLPLTKENMKTILDYRKNPIIKSNYNKSYSNEWLELYFKSALGKHKPLDIKMYDEVSIKEYLLYRILDKFEKSPASRRYTKMDLLQEIIHKINYLTLNNDARKGMSYLMSTNSLSELSNIELMAFICGYERDSLWAVPERGRSAVEIMTEMMYEEKIKPALACRIISYIVLESKSPISVTTEFDWSSIEDTPSHWAHSLLPSKSTRRVSTYPEILTKMKN